MVTDNSLLISYTILRQVNTVMRLHYRILFARGGDSNSRGLSKTNEREVRRSE
jgi:hypothetical protein